jgi:hypothetical protein
MDRYFNAPTSNAMSLESRLLPYAVCIGEAANAPVPTDSFFKRSQSETEIHKSLRCCRTHTEPIRIIIGVT